MLPTEKTTNDKSTGLTVTPATVLSQSESTEPTDNGPTEAQIASGWYELPPELRAATAKKEATAKPDSSVLGAVKGTITPTLQPEPEDLRTAALDLGDLYQALDPLYAAISAQRDALLALRDLAVHGVNLINYETTLRVFADSIQNVDDILRAA